MERTRTCRDCGGRMAEGFVADDTYGGTFDFGRWFAGTPARRWTGGLKVRKKDGLEVATFRCERCGVLQSYA